MFIRSILCYDRNFNILLIDKWELMIFTSALPQHVLVILHVYEWCSFNKWSSVTDTSVREELVVGVSGVWLTHILIWLFISLHYSAPHRQPCSPTHSCQHTEQSSNWAEAQLYYKLEWKSEIHSISFCIWFSLPVIQVLKMSCINVWQWSGACLLTFPIWITPSIETSCWNRSHITL